MIEEMEKKEERAILEESVLGSILLDPSKYREVAAVLEEAALEAAQKEGE